MIDGIVSFYKECNNSIEDLRIMLEYEAPYNVCTVSDYGGIKLINGFPSHSKGLVL